MKQILFDCERMKYNHTGLYHYCLQLGKALMRVSDADKESITCYVRPSEQEAFGENAKYLSQHSLHKFLLPSLRRFDIWHATYQATQYFPFSRKIKVVLTIHDLNFLYDEHKEEFKKKREIKKLQQKIDRADHIVTISEFVADDVRKNLRVGNKPITVIYNGCNIKTIENLEVPTIRPQGKFLYTIGTIVDKKNFHVLPCLLQNNELQLLISGITQSENYHAKILAEAARYGVSDRVIFTGPVSENDKQWYMKNAEAFLFPSLAEGFGLPVVEAMFFGKPVILSTHTALPEIGGDAAYYFTNFDPQNMCATLHQSLKDFAAHPEKAQRAAARAASFNWDDMARQYLEVYRSLY
jgi:glycosyltransferase involved in cell wall biosynthesis